MSLFDQLNDDSVNSTFFYLMDRFSVLFSLEVKISIMPFGITTDAESN